MPSASSRAALAIILVAGFYVFSLAIVAGLLYVPCAFWRHFGYLNPLLMLLCVPAALVILWSILPRRDRSVPPGLSLKREEQPGLFQLIEEVAEATGQKPPREVHLLPKAQAWVTHRGGIMGFGAERVLGIGLPLLEALSVQQLRAILAHEFGHFHGDEMKLGPWIHKTRSAIGRTRESLGRYSARFKILFTLYAAVFLRITQEVSRQQELIADELAARTIGARPLIDGLRLLDCTAPACDAYWFNWVQPILSRGFHPPLTEGCRRFLDSYSVTGAITECVDDPLPEDEADPYDTHPSLHERVSALEKWPRGEALDDDPPASSLLENAETLERQLVRFILGEAAAESLTPVTWDVVGREIWLPEQEELARKYTGALSRISPGLFPRMARDLVGFSRELGDPAEGDATDEERCEWASEILGTALAVALCHQGWNLKFNLGEDVVLEREGTAIKPFTIVPKLASGEFSSEKWNEICEKAGIGDLNLGV